jgi:hypothetical protein
MARRLAWWPIVVTFPGWHDDHRRPDRPAARSARRRIRGRALRQFQHVQAAYRAPKRAVAVNSHLTVIVLPEPTRASLSVRK